MMFRSVFLPLLVLATIAIPCPAYANAQPNDMPVADIRYLMEADAAIKSGRYIQAEQMLALLKNDARPSLRDDVALLHAEYYSAEGRLAEAVAALAEIKDKGRNACRQDSMRGWVARKQGDASQSILFLVRAVKACPDDVGAWNLLGLAFAEKGEIAASREAFERALALSPQQSGLLNNYALVLLQAGDAGAASQKLGEALAADPLSPAIIANRDFVNAILGSKPIRVPGETETQWANRLLSAGTGAQVGQNAVLAKSLFSQAVLLLDHFDAKAWSVATQFNPAPTE